MSASPITEKTPAAGGHQREGENPNPYARNQIMSNPTPDHWATDSEVSDDDLPFIVHSRELTSGPFDMVIAHTFCGTDLGTDVIVKWDEPGDVKGITHSEEFAVRVSRISALTAALDEAAGIVEGVSNPTLRPVDRAMQELTKTIEELDRQGLHDLALTVTFSLIRLRTRALADQSVRAAAEENHA